VSTGAQYVVAAYGVVLFALLIYVVVIGMRSARMAREAELLGTLVEREEDEDGEDDQAGARPGPPATGSRRA
jgi:hypothetical protein